MPTATAKVNQIKGLVPALDRKQVGAPFVVDGRNFLVDAEGPHSAFGSQFLTYDRLVDSAFSQSLKLTNTLSVVFVSNAVLKYDVISQKYYSIFNFTPPTEDPYPWSHALVGGVHYFARHGMKLLQYFPLSETWNELDENNTPGLAPDIYAITAVSGRLIIAADGLVQWSAIDNGANVVTSTATGAGAQSLAIVNNGRPLGIKATATGFTTYTTEGIMRSELIQSINPFRHDTLSVEHAPLSPWCITEIAKNAVVFLDRTGLYRTNGQAIEPWQSLMSEYFNLHILQNYDISLPDNSQIKLSYINEKQWFIISVSTTGQEGVYSWAYVLYLPRDEWGIFNAQHTTFGAFILTEGPEIGFNVGYVTPEGYVSLFIESPIKESQESLPDYRFVQLDLEYPSCSEAGVICAAVEINITNYDKSIYTLSGLYDAHPIITAGSPDTITADGDEVGSVVPRDFRSIDSYANIGIFRFDDQQNPDRFSYMSALAVGMKKGAGEEDFEDWNLPERSDIFEDWNVLEGQEDWGSGILDTVQYSLAVQGTTDGYIQYEDQLEVPEEISATTEETVYSRYFTCYNMGIYHIINISAQLDGESFHIKYLEPALAPGGRI